MRVFGIGLVASAFLLTLLWSPVVGQEAEEPVRRTSDSKLLERYRNGEEKVLGLRWHRIHDNPVAGQGAVYRWFGGTEETFRVAFREGNLCIVEYRTSQREIVFAYEFELAGSLRGYIRRAWVGGPGEKPSAAKIASPFEYLNTRTGYPPRLRHSHRHLDRKRFTDADFGGVRWSGTVTIESFFPGEEKAYTERTWRSEQNWFNMPVRQERESKDKIDCSGMVRVSKDLEPLLDWSGFAMPTPEENEEIRRPLLDETRKFERWDLCRDHWGNLFGLHPGAKVGDWAEYGDYRLTLVKLEQGRGIVEQTRPGDELNLVEAIEFEVVDGKAGQMVARYVGVAGESPTRTGLVGWDTPAPRPGPVVVGKTCDLEMAGKAWTATENRETRQYDETQQIVDTLESENAPFGQPLRSRVFFVYDEESASMTELTAFGDGGVAALDWSTWVPAEEK